MARILNFFLLAIAVSGIFFYSCGQGSGQPQSTSANKAWVKDEIADSNAVMRTERSVALALKISIADSATYFYKRAYLDAALAAKVSNSDTTNRWAPKGTYQSPIVNIADTSKYIEYADTTLLIAMQWELDGKQDKGTDTLSYSWGIMDTVTTGDLVGWKVPTDITILEVAGYTDANTVTFNLEERAETTPNTAGTDVLTVDLTCDTNQDEETSFTNASISKNSWLVPTISNTGDVAIFGITIRYVKVY